MAPFKKSKGRKPAPPKIPERSKSSSADILAENASGTEDGTPGSERTTTRRALFVRPKPIVKKDEYVYYEPKDEVEGIIREYSRKGDMFYEVRLFGDTTKEVSEHGKGSSLEQ